MRHSGICQQEQQFEAACAVAKLTNRLPVCRLSRTVLLLLLLMSVLLTPALRCCCCCCCSNP
jgi:hypothetical protein